MFLKKKKIGGLLITLFFALAILFSSFFNFQKNNVLAASDPVVFNNTSTGSTGTIQTWVVPITGTYRITAYGAGFGAVSNQKGAKMSGEFDLTAGQELKILVGQMGDNARVGSGGTFVTLSDNTPLIIAGGAGGYEHLDSVNIQGTIEALGNRGAQTVDRTSGEGQGGDYTGASSSYPAGGGGLLSQGKNRGVVVDHGGRAFTSGGAGGTGAAGYNGGFGGGGALLNSAAYRVSGGGGYSGGMGSYGTSGNYGGGGGSYNSGTNQDNASGVRSGHGLVEILEVETIVPDVAIGSNETGFKIEKNSITTGVTINAHDICKVVKNYSATKDYFIPTKTAEEWMYFISRAPVIADIALSECDTCAQNFGDGSDGAFTASSLNQVINTYTNLTAFDISGTVINVGSTLGFSVGDEILVLQHYYSSTGAAEGSYEFAKIESIDTTSNTITPSSPLQHRYSDGAQVIRVPQYTSFNIPSLTSVTATPWNGEYGGVVVFRASGNVVIDGSIDVTGDGFRGGKSQTTNYADGIAGESTTGYSTAADTSQLGKDLGGGPGGKDSGGTGKWGGGGLGGGYGSAGADYPAQPSSTYCGLSGAYSGGGTYGVSDLSKFFLGSGGGSGGRQDDGAGSGVGGSGGGGVIIFADFIDVNGSILARGDNGGSAPSTAMGCGGGGSGGSIYLFSQRVDSGNINATGGTSPSPCGGSRCNGSNGGTGRIAIYTDDNNALSNPAAYTNTACGGAASYCGAGYYLDGSVCAISPAGYYSPLGDNYLYPCGDASKWSSMGAEYCSNVSVGYYTTGGTATTRTGQAQCSCGTYCISGWQYDCAAGYYGATVGLSVSTCTGDCKYNDYYSTAGSCVCSQVAPGEYTTGGTETTRTGKATCEEGYYCPGPGDGGKYMCPDGTTSPAGTVLASDCVGGTACGAGYYLDGGSCTCVEDGYYSPVNDDNRYICPAGSYCSGCAAAPTCCPDGTYSTATGNTSVSSCTNCSAGTAGVGDCQTSNTCATCSAGYYSTTGSSSCSICAAGTYSTTGSSSCSTCPAGTYSTAGSGVCTTCSAGYYSTSGSSSCTICPIGTYSSASSGSCTDCPAGYTTASEGSDSLADCSIPTSGCGAGYYFYNDACTCVGNGYYSPDADNSRYTCPAGSYCSGCSGAPTSCSAGTYSSSGASSCTSCLCSTYNSTSGSTSCITGSNGYNCATGSTSSTANACASGYNSTTSDCSYTCSAGYYDSNRNGICEQVTGAYYSPANDYRRYSCPAGYTAPSGSDSSADCTIPTTGCGAGYYLYNSVCTCVGNGYYSPDDNNNRYTCPAGSYCSGCSASGTACAAGTYSSAGASSCITCPAGSYNTTTGNSSCTTCPAGRYCTGGTNVTCCPDGRYRTTTGGTSVSSCTLCAAGTYGVGTCQTSNTCATCPAGYYCPSGASTYSACSAGSYSTSGSSSCTSCPPGKYSSTSASSSCSNCAGGYYGSSYGNTSSTCDGCCEGGHYCPAGSTSSMQNRCPSGTDSDPYSDSSADCIACPAGTFYMDSINYPVGTSVLYIECENGYNNCITCPEGSYCTGGTRYSCPAGKYNPNSGSTSSAACSTCPANSYCTGSSTYYTSTYYE